MERPGQELTPAGRRRGGAAMLARAALTVIVRPELWSTALSQAVRLARPGWWRRWPPLPVPAPDYLRFRLQTMYGDPDRRPEPADLLAYLRWCRRLRGSVG